MRGEEALPASSMASSTCSAAMRSTSGTRVVEVVDEDDRAEIAPARARRLGARQRLAAAARRPPRPHRAKPASSVIRIDCAAASCSAWASRSAAIQSGSLSRVGDDQHFRRPGDHVDADGAEHLPLGGRDIGVARPDDLGDRRGSSRCRRQARRSPARRRRGRSRDTPARSAATSTSGLMSPPGAGTAITMRSTPATLAGTAFISTELG